MADGTKLYNTAASLLIENMIPVVHWKMLLKIQSQIYVTDLIFSTLLYSKYYCCLHIEAIGEKRNMSLHDSRFRPIALMGQLKCRNQAGWKQHHPSQL